MEKEKKLEGAHYRPGIDCIGNTSPYYEAKRERLNPSYYKNHPSGIECIEIARHHCFSIGNVFKYIWRAGLKTEEGVDNIDKEIEDLNKAIWYLHDRISELEYKKQLPF